MEPTNEQPSENPYIQPVNTDLAPPVDPGPTVLPSAEPAPNLSNVQPVAPLQQPVAGPSLPQQPYEQPQAMASVNSPGLIVLQWLTYAFWGWTILAMSVLTVTVLANLIAKSETGSFTPYGIAAVLVLLPISIACDVFYSKKEPAKKTGAASIVMVIHAVIFALFGIGAVIAIVFSLVQMLTSSGDNSGTQVSLYSAMIIAILYGAAFLRTINPARIPILKRSYIIFMTIVVGIIAVLGLVGPVAHERATRNDRLITSNIHSLKTSIDSYAKSKNRLPDTLNELDLTGNAKLLVDKNLVKYTAHKQPSSSVSKSTGVGTRRTTSTNTIYYYELCITYAKELKNKYSSSGSNNKADSDGYVTYLDTYYGAHPAGEKCYKVKTEDYGY